MAFPSSFVEIKTPAFQVSENGYRGTRYFRCNWSDIDSVIDEAYKPVLVGGDHIVHRGLLFPGKPWMRLVDVAIEGQDPDNLEAKSDETDQHGIVATSASGCLLNFEYATKEARERQGGDDDNAEEDELSRLSLRVNIGAEIMRVPTSKATEWSVEGQGSGTTATTDDVVIHKVIPLESWEVRWPEVPRPNWSAFRDQAGTVNFYTFLGCESETVLFMGTESEEGIHPSGMSVWDVTLRFDVRRIIYTDSEGNSAVAGWNHIYRPDADTTAEDIWQKVTPSIYDYSDFSNLFKAGSIDMYQTLRGEIFSGWGESA